VLNQDVLLDGQVRPVVSVGAKPVLARLRYVLVNHPDQFPAVVAAVGRAKRIGLDLQTTGLNPRTDRVRLLTLAVDDPACNVCSYVVDCSAVHPRSLWPALASAELLLHDGVRVLTFLARRGFEPPRFRDTRLLSQLLLAGTDESCRLEDCTRSELGITLNRSCHPSSWLRALTHDQIEQAGTHAAVLQPLYDRLAAKIEAAGLDRVADVEHRALPAIAWMASKGVPCDGRRWQQLAAAAKEEADRLRAELIAIGGEYDWDNAEQVKEALLRVGCRVPDTTKETLATAGNPIAALVCRYRKARSLVLTHGENWLKHVADEGRIYADWDQYGAVTGRMSVSAPSLQNTPGDHRYRECFRAPPGRVLVKADQSQIELRITAKVASESAMIEALVRGEDLHRLTALQMTGRSIVSDDERERAKPVNFGLIYGQGAETLREKARADFAVEMTLPEANRYRATFFATYQGIARWHDAIRSSAATETRTLTGRRALVKADDFYGGKANYVVQGTGADGLKLALALLWERRREVPGAFPVMAVHDEIVVECDVDQADAAADWLKRAMTDAMAPLIDPVPVKVEVSVGETWAG
jgi:DNA polymerase-1